MDDTKNVTVSLSALKQTIRTYVEDHPSMIDSLKTFVDSLDSSDHHSRNANNLWGVWVGVGAVAVVILALAILVAMLAKRRASRASIVEESPVRANRSIGGAPYVNCLRRKGSDEKNRSMIRQQLLHDVGGQVGGVERV